MLATTPKFSTQEALGIASRLYNLWGSCNIENLFGKISSLPSERDQNFKLITESGKYVLKVSNSLENRADIEFQNEVLSLLNEKGTINVAKLICTVEGNAIGMVDGDNGSKHMVRLLTYLPGKPLGACSPKSKQLLFNVGRYFGELDHAMAHFQHPVADRYLQWDLKHGVSVINAYKNKILSSERRHIVEDILSDFITNVEPVLQSLRTSIIHNDGNDYNILVEEIADEVREAGLVTGVIDFGDMLRTYTVRNRSLKRVTPSINRQNR